MRQLCLILPALAAAAVFAVPASAATCDGADLRPSGSNMDEVQHATLCLLNEERTSRGLSRLREHGALERAASGYSRLMVREDFFSHTSPNGSTMVDRIRGADYLDGARTWSIGENIAWGAGSAGTPERIVRAWMRSAGHRENILDPAFREIGIGVSFGAPRPISGTGGAATYTTDFGRRT